MRHLQFGRPGTADDALKAAAHFSTTWRTAIKKILIVAIAAAGAVIAKKKLDQGKQEQALWLPELRQHRRIYDEHQGDRNGDARAHP